MLRSHDLIRHPNWMSLEGDYPMVHNDISHFLKCCLGGCQQFFFEVLFGRLPAILNRTEIQDIFFLHVLCPYAPLWIMTDLSISTPYLYISALSRRVYPATFGDFPLLGRSTDEAQLKKYSRLFSSFHRLTKLRFLALPYPLSPCSSNTKSCFSNSHGFTTGSKIWSMYTCSDIFPFVFPGG